MAQITIVARIVVGDGTGATSRVSSGYQAQASYVAGSPAPLPLPRAVVRLDAFHNAYLPLTSRPAMRQWRGSGIPASDLLAVVASERTPGATAYEGRSRRPRVGRGG